MFSTVRPLAPHLQYRHAPLEGRAPQFENHWSGQMPIKYILDNKIHHHFGFMKSEIKLGGGIKVITHRQILQVLALVLGRQKKKTCCFQQRCLWRLSMSVAFLPLLRSSEGN